MRSKGIFIVAPTDWSLDKGYPDENSLPQVYHVCFKHGSGSYSNAYAEDRYDELATFGTMEDAVREAVKRGCVRPFVI